MAKDWIQKAIKKPGSLRETLNVNKGKDIPDSKLKRAAEGKGVSKKTQKRAVLAETLKKMRKK